MEKMCFVRQCISKYINKMYLIGKKNKPVVEGLEKFVPY
jgi:hypothetical protein